MRSIKGSFAMFIDRLDQALNTCLERSEDHSLDDQKGNSYHFLVWRHAQTGLLESSYEIYTLNRHIKIYCTARKESLGMKYLKENLREYATELEYNYEELEEIFVNNIKEVNKAKLIEPNAKDPFNRLFGFNEIPHIHAKDEKGVAKTESVFGLIYRHTFGRPREIVVVGRKLFEDVLDRENYRKIDQERRMEAVRRKVDNTAYEVLFEDYTNGIVPSFKEDIFEELIEKVNSNVFAETQLRNLHSDDYNYLYRLGLIGYVKSNQQHFVPAASHVNNENLMIEKSEYYLVHPAADRKLQRTTLYEEFYDDNNIVGNGYHFDPPSMLAISNSEIESFIPKRVAGKTGLDKANPNYSIHVSYRQLYEAFFDGEQQAKSIIRFRKDRFSKITKLYLSRVADLVMLEILETYFEKKYSKWRQTIERDLKQNHTNWAFQTKIETCNEEDLIHFGQRLIGRLMSLGMYCYLKLNPNQIQNLVCGTSRDLSFRPQDNDKSVRYLWKSFFIKGLKADGLAPYYPLDKTKVYSVLKMNPDSETVLENCSDFEQQQLKNWWKNYLYHDLLTNKELNTEEIQFLEEQME